MRILAFEHAGSLPFPKPIALYPAELPQLIAVAGPNGAGKTSLLDLMTCGTLYATGGFRQVPLTKLFADRGYIRTRWAVGDTEYASVIMVDPASGRTEASLHDAGGVVIAGPLVTEYRKAVQRIMGSQDLFLSTAYSVQPSSATDKSAMTFLKADRADRKRMLIELLGLDRYPAFEAKAKATAQGLEKQLIAFRERYRALKEAAAGEAGAIEQRTAQLAARAEAEIGLGRAQAALDRALPVPQGLRERIAALAPQRAILSDVMAQAGQVATRIERARKAIAGEQALLPQRAAITAAQGELATLDGDLQALAGDLMVANAQRLAWTAAQGNLTLQKAEADRARQRLEDLRRRGGLVQQVPCRGEGVYAGCPLLTEAMAAVRQEPDQAVAVLAANQAVVQALDLPPNPDLAAFQAREQQLRSRRATVKALADQAVALAQADGKITAAEQVITEHEARLTALTAQRVAAEQVLATLPSLERQLTEADRAVALAKTVVQASQAAIVEIRQAIGVLDGKIAVAREARAQLKACADEALPVRADADDWDLIAAAMAVTGIPTFRIDTALPSISDLATTFLRECFGEALFSLLLSTQRESADGKRLLETLDIQIVRNGEPVLVELLSGGEGVLVSEALALAIGHERNSRGMGRVETLFRDEVFSALEGPRVRAYVNMLRQAGRFGFRQAFFVSHDPVALEMADVTLLVHDGTVEVT